jgi:hypothetical protein
MGYKKESTQIRNTISLLAKSRKKKVKTLKVYNDQGLEAPSLGINPNYMGLECCYISAAELSARWLKLCVEKKYIASHYANGKLLIYIGRYNYPVYGVMQPHKITLSTLRYLHKCIK